MSRLTDTTVPPSPGPLATLLPAAVLARCWVLAGPTATGKTAVSLEIAKRLPVEIIALDSMTVYRGLDLGTAKPTAEERAVCPHHLIDVVDPAQDFSVQDYLSLVEPVCTAILQRGRTPLFVGGSGLYLRSLLRGLFQGPAADEELRLQWERRAEQVGPQALHAELQSRDPVTAARLHPHDQRRIIRAIEVYELTGRTLSSQQLQPIRPVEAQPAVCLWLAPPRDWLHERIDRRVEQMLHAGLIEESRNVLDQLTSQGLPLSRTVGQAIGYREVWNWLATSPPRPELQTLSAEIQQHTRQFSKRQQTWFRNLSECRAVPIEPSESAVEIAERIIRHHSTPAVMG